MTDSLVLVPGMMCDARVFEPQITALSADCVVTVLPVTGSDRIEVIARECLEQLPAKFALAGLSMGGIVAMEMLAQAPDRITRLCLMDTNPLAEAPQVAAAREPMIVGAKSGRLDEVLREGLTPDHLAPGPNRVTVLNRMYQMGQELGPDIFVRQSRALQRRRDQQATLRRCQVPTLIVCGAHDTLTPIKRHEFMAQLIPDAKLRIIENAGHLPPLEQPEIVTALLREWLGQPLVLRASG